MEDELGPILQGLDPVGAEAAEIEAQARKRAETVREESVRDAAAILSEARGRAEAERARAAAQLRSDARHAAAAIRADATREARRIAEARDHRVAELVAEVVACVGRSAR
jgi:hypothetical protein